ncbi:hypothetical protein [Falsirhodobacter sp. 1013]|uniref:hypothetical protein n=1 Tax=Falsirhodobacter sp. 1013 TaxID=3417566 RepID=UPI003EB9658B
MTAPPEPRQGRRSMGRYLLALVAGALMVPGLFLLMLALLDPDETRPPPQFSNSLCVDEKLAAMRRSPPQDPDLLVIGSSVAWRHFNSPEAIELRPGLHPYNAGFCGANIKQTEAVANWMLTRLPSLKEVILIASPVDFEHCEDQSTNTLFPAGFDVTEADTFVFADGSPLLYYLRYFDPMTLWRNGRGLEARRTDIRSYASLVTDEFGDGPIEPPGSRRLLYGAPTFDAACFAGLHRIGMELRKRGIGFHVAVTPLHPEWLRLYDQGGQVTATLDTAIREALAGTGGRFIKAGTGIEEAAFFDGIHLRWSYTDEYTRFLLAEVRPSG